MKVSGDVLRSATLVGIESAKADFVVLQPGFQPGNRSLGFASSGHRPASPPAPAL